jgi:hypothetical protein
VPAGMSAAAVSEAGDVSDEDLVRTEGVTVRAAGRWVGGPLPVGCSDKLTCTPNSPYSARGAQPNSRC